MGLASSRFNIYKDVPQITPLRATFEALQLTEGDVGRMYKLFLKITGPNNVCVDHKALLDFLDVDRNPFTMRVFKVFDEGLIDFREFVISSWNYCTLGSTTLAQFAFDLYDRDNSGQIDAEEVDLMLRDIYGSRYKKNLHATRISEKLSVMRQVEFDRDNFREFVRKHPSMLYPAFEMQKKIKRCILGMRFWEEYSARRLEMSNGQYMSIAQIIKLLHETKVQSRLKAIPAESAADALDFNELLAEKKQQQQGKWYEGKQLDRDVHIKGDVPPKPRQEQGPSCWGSLRRAMGIPPPRADRDTSREAMSRQVSKDMSGKSPSDVWKTASPAGTAVTQKYQSRRTLRSESTVSLVGECSDADRSSDVRAMSKDNINTVLHSYGLSTRRQRGLSSKMSSGGVEEEAYSTGGDQKPSKGDRLRRHSTIAPTAPDWGGNGSTSTSRRETRRSISDTTGDVDTRRKAARRGSLTGHSNKRHRSDVLTTVDGHASNVPSYDEAVEASSQWREARREVTERSRVRALAEASAGAGRPEKIRRR